MDRLHSRSLCPPSDRDELASRRLQRQDIGLGPQSNGIPRNLSGSHRTDTPPLTVRCSGPCSEHCSGRCSGRCRTSRHDEFRQERIFVGSEPAAEIAAGPRRERDGGFTKSPDRMIAACAEALFASDLSIQCHPSEAAVAAAIRNAVGAHGGGRGCAGEVGAAYGDHPETAATRMRWARQVIEAIYSPAAASAETAIGPGQPRTRAGETDRLERGRQS